VGDVRGAGNVEFADSATRDNKDVSNHHMSLMSQFITAVPPRAGTPTDSGGGPNRLTGMCGA